MSKKWHLDIISHRERTDIKNYEDPVITVIILIYYQVHLMYMCHKFFILNYLYSLVVIDQNIYIKNDMQIHA